MSRYLRAIRTALPSLRQAAYPRIVNIASTEALGAMRYGSAYAVAKHASVGLTRAVAVDPGKEGITVNCGCPEPIHTGITSGPSGDDKATFANPSNGTAPLWGAGGGGPHHKPRCAIHAACFFYTTGCRIALRWSR